MRLDDKTAVITGAANGQGREVAFHFSRLGAQLILVDRDEQSLAGLQADLEGRGVSAETWAFDVSAEDAWTNFSRANQDRSIDILYNNAAIFPAEDAGTIDTPLAEWDQVMAVNVKGVLLGSRAVVPMMSGGGSIINVASIRAWLGTSNCRHAYATSKAAVIGLSKSMAVELGPQGIRVNVIAPGTIDTAMATAHGDHELGIRLGRYPLGRFGTPGDIAPAAAFLASDAATWISGATLVIDGATSAFYV
jgi:NAD(P)-dependent dehydrogenase (short-subunit alcohol dehydrogenase family)